MNVIDVPVEHEVSKFLLCRSPVQKLAGADVANNGEVQKQRVPQQLPNPLVRCEVSLRPKCVPVLVALGQLDKGGVELRFGQAKYLDRLNEPKARGIGAQQLLILLSPTRHDHPHLVGQPHYKLVETFRKVGPHLGRNLVETIQDEAVPAGADERIGDGTLADLVADFRAQVVNEERFEVVLSFPRREVDQKRYSSRSTFGFVEVLDQGVGSHGLARTRFSDDE